jgi:hypothetical protein
MQFLSIAIALALGALALAYVLYPFYRRTSTPPPRAEEGAHMGRLSSREASSGAGARFHRERAYDPDVAVSRQSEREQAARSALREIELDYQLGNISEGDYRSLRERYVRRALVALKSRYARDQGLDESIEAQVRQLREKNDSANSN